LAVTIRHATRSSSSSSIRLTAMQTRRATEATKDTSAAVAPPAPTTQISAQTVLWTGIRDNIRRRSRGSNRCRCTLLDTLVIVLLCCKLGHSRICVGTRLCINVHLETFQMVSYKKLTHCSCRL
jgi:hypothetical protein